MPYLKKIDTGAVTDYLETDAAEYQILSKMRFTEDVEVSGTGGFGAGSGGAYKARKGEPIWEAIAFQDIKELEASGGGPAKRAAVIWCPGAAKGTSITSGQLFNSVVGGKLTAVAYVPLGAMGETPAETNYRTLTLEQYIVAVGGGAEKATTKLEKIAKVTFKKTTNTGLLVPTAGVLEGSEKFTSQSQLFVTSANGAGEEVDPGGVFYAIYTKE